MKYFKFKIFYLSWPILALSVSFFPPLTSARRIKGAEFVLGREGRKIIFPQETIVRLRELLSLSKELKDIEIGGIGERESNGMVRQFFIPQREEMAIIRVYPEFWGIFDENPIKDITIGLSQLIRETRRPGLEEAEFLNRLNSFVRMLRRREQAYGKKIVIELKDDLKIDSKTAISETEAGQFIRVLKGVKAVASEGSFFLVDKTEHFFGRVDIHNHPGEPAPPSIPDIAFWFGVGNPTLFAKALITYQGIIMDTSEGKKLLLFEINTQDMETYKKFLQIAVSYMIEQAVKEGNRREEAVWRSRLEDLGEKEPLPDWYSALEEMALKDKNGHLPILAPRD